MRFATSYNAFGQPRLLLFEEQKDRRRRKGELVMDFERIPGVVDAFHHGHLPTEAGWRESLLKMEQVVIALEGKLAELDARISCDPSSASRLAHERKDLDRKLQGAKRKRVLIEGAIRARLVRDPSSASTGQESASRSAAGERSS